MNHSPPRYLVTGGTGFLGTELVRILLAQGAQVRVLARSTDPTLQQQGAQFVTGSVLDAERLAHACSGVTSIFHLAGQVVLSRRHGYREMRELHVDGSVNVVNAAADAGIRRIVYASTSGTVAVSKAPNFVGTDSSPYASLLVRPWPYYLTKIEAERAARDRARVRHLELVSMRPSLILGPGDVRLSSSRTIYDFLRRAIPVVPPGGLSIVDVRDAANAFIAAEKMGKPDATYLLGSANLDFKEFFQALTAVSGVASPTTRVPQPLSMLTAHASVAFSKLLGKEFPSLDPVAVEMAAHFWYLDSSSARADLGFNPRPIAETLRDSVDWIRGNFAECRSPGVAHAPLS